MRIMKHNEVVLCVDNNKLIIGDSSSSSSNNNNEYRYNDKDNDFMIMITNVLTNKPKTWTKYNHDFDSAYQILNMEIGELMNAKQQKDIAILKENLVHVAVACKNMYEVL